nr:retrovirus-related Pol polyprotein from transposon TNT 1-94 [Tanacetum cinerariifolium]
MTTRHKDTDEEVDKQELEAHYSYMAKIQEVPTADSGTDSEPVEQQLKKANTTLAQELKEYKAILAKTSKSLGESISVRDSCLVALQTKQTEFEKYKAFNDRTIDYDKLEQIVDNAWIKLSKDQFCAPTAQDMEILIQTCLMPLAIKTQNDSFKFVHELKQEMHVDLKYVESLEKEINELKSNKAEFSDMYDVILQECVSKDVMCSYLMSLSDLDALAELQCLYLHKVKECDCLAQTLSKQTESVRVNHNTNVSRLQHKRNQSRDKVLPNNSQVKVKKTQVEVHPRISSVSNKMNSVTACKDSLNSRTLNANAVCATCNKCLVVSNHFACVTKMLNDVHARTKKRTVIVQLIIFIVDSRYTKHMTGNLKLLCDFIEKFFGTVCFGNDQFAPILGYGDLVQGNVTINRVYYVKGLNHNLFSVGQFCDADLEVAFRKSTCFVRDLQGNDLLTGNHGSDLYTISLQELTSSTPLCLMAKATPTQAWLWYRRLSHLNFDYINLLSKKDIVIGLPKLKYVKDQLCSSCELSKAKRSPNLS